jgi:hypothetical protein
MPCPTHVGIIGIAGKVSVTARAKRQSGTEIRIPGKRFALPAQSLLPAFGKREQTDRGQTRLCSGRGR